MTSAKEFPLLIKIQQFKCQRRIKVNTLPSRCSCLSLSVCIGLSVSVCLYLSVSASDGDTKVYIIHCTDIYIYTYIYIYRYIYIIYICTDIYILHIYILLTEVVY